ncbi:protein of unknown function (plasmid) [Cupriavidus neocaledonicus]|uniref:Uncharacterized protein n=1 Tax=Cupriavidus neocaledonicus TaxID=1040979 RepID=A0A375HU44_9BURK|nr:hypothetical protein CBM2605_B40008 [Cupriavidus neocaledonicus]SPD60995.1 protein of unknown function [Cupriavidus neocaledonicus]
MFADFFFAALAAIVPRWTEDSGICMRLTEYPKAEIDLPQFCNVTLLKKGMSSGLPAGPSMIA